jgi:hypothetical protein
MSTFATLLVLPSIFAVVIGNKVHQSPSIYPDDPDSPHYDPHLYDREHESAQEVASNGEVAPSKKVNPDKVHAPDKKVVPLEAQLSHH